MNKPVRKASFFALAGGSWQDRFKALTGRAPKGGPSAKLEIDDANGEKMIFPEIGDPSEIAEGVTVEATDGEHVFTQDASTYTVKVENGKVTLVTKTEDTPPADPPADPAALNEETMAFVEAVGEELNANEAFRAEAAGQIAELTTALAAATKRIDDLTALMAHGGDDPTDPPAPKTSTIGGKKIDFSKINLQSKK